MYPPQPPQPPYSQPDPNQQGYAQPPYVQPPYGQPPGGQEAYGLPPNPYAPPSTPMQPPYAAPQPPNPYAPPSMPMQQPNPYAPPSMPMQPMQQPMYGMPASMAAPNALNFNAFTLPQNRGNLFAAIGGVVALLSFFLFDFWGVSGGGLSFNFKATDLASGHFESISLGHSYPLLWLVPLAALVAAAVAIIIVLGIRSVQGLTPRNAAISIISAGAVGLACLLISVLQFNGDLGTSGQSVSGVSYGYGFGFWLTLLALVAVLGGGILTLRQMQAQPTYMPPPPYMGGYPPQMPPMQ